MTPKKNQRQKGLVLHGFARFNDDFEILVFISLTGQQVTWLFCQDMGQLAMTYKNVPCQILLEGGKLCVQVQIHTVLEAFFELGKVSAQNLIYII